MSPFPAFDKVELLVKRLRRPCN